MGGPVRAAANQPQQEQPQREVRTGRRPTHRSRSNRNGRPSQGGGEPTAAGATTKGGPVRAVVNPPQREQPQREAQSGRQPTNRSRSNLNRRSGQGGGQPTAAGATATGGPVRAVVNPPQQEQPQREARSGRWSTHRSGSNRNGRPGARGEPGNSGRRSTHRSKSNRNGRPGARGDPHNGHRNQCGGGTRPRG